MKPFCSTLLAALLVLLTSCAATAPTLARADESFPAALPPPLEQPPSLEQPTPAAPAPIEPAVTLPPSLTYPRITLADSLSVYPAEPVPRDIGIRVFPQDAAILRALDGELITLTAARREKDTAWFTTDASAVGFRAEGYHPQVVRLAEGEITEVKLERINPAVNRIGELPTGYQPKSVRFSPDGRYLFTTHLGDRTAINQYRVNPFEWVRSLNVPDEYAQFQGFVESFILEQRKELWISQMTTNLLHVFDLESGVYLSRVELSGSWPKLLLASPDEKRMYVSCWISHSVSVIDTALRREVMSIGTGPIPRGLSLSPDASELLVTRFSDSAVDRINLSIGQTRAVHDSGPNKSFAMRHIVHDTRRSEYYITAMGADRVYRLSEAGEWRGYWKVGEKPNTCDISPDGRWLIVSCRGPNNPDTGYLTKGYEYGKIYFIDLEAGEVATWIWGQDQPTGLDISPDGRYLAFTDFLSQSLELYRLH